MSVIGIDFGNDNCYIAVARAGGIETIANDYSQRATPSFVAFCKRNRVLGVAAKNQLITNLNNTVYGFKRLLGRKYRDSFSLKELTYLPYDVCELPNGSIGVKVTYLQKETVFSVVQIAAMLFTKLKETAETALNTSVRGCVLSVPSYFSDAERRAVLDACAIAKLNVFRLMNETTAGVNGLTKFIDRKAQLHFTIVALLYGFYKQDLPEKKPIVVVFLSIGHATTEVSVCSFTKGKLQVLCSEWDTNVGGRDVDNAMSRHFVEEFKSSYNVDALSNKRSTVRLIQECEKLKKQLSANPQSLPLNIESLIGDMDVRGRMGREELESLIGDLLSRIEITLHRALTGANVSPNDVSAVEVIGGSSRIPVIKSLVQKVFGRDPSTTLNLDEAVARGCALQCAILSPTYKVKEYCVTDVQPYPIKLVWNGKEGEVEVFPKKHEIPFSKFLTFYRKEEFSLEAQYGETCGEPRPNKIIGVFTVKNVNGTVFKECIQIKVKVRIDIDGIFSVCSAIVNSEFSNSKNEVPDQKLEAMADMDNKLSSLNRMNSPQKSPKKEKEKEQPAHKKNRTVNPPELPVESRVHQLSVVEIEKLTEEEANMIEQDSLENERVDAKNALEEYMYNLRSQLGSELQNFIDQQECQDFLNRLETLENWLYEGGSDENKVVYICKLSQLKESAEPILLRRTEYEERPAALAELQAVLKESHSVLEKVLSGDQQFSGIEPKEIDELQEHVDEVSRWIDDIHPSLMQIKCHQNPPVLVAKINKETKLLQNILSSVLNRTSQNDSPGASENSPKGDTNKRSPTKRRNL